MSGGDDARDGTGDHQQAELLLEILFLRFQPIDLGLFRFDFLKPTARQ